MGKIKEKPPVKAARKEKLRAAPKEVIRRGLDGGVARLRAQLRDAAQGGRRDENGGDRMEDAAAGAVQAGGRWAGRRLEGIRRWWADNRTVQTKEPPGPQNAPEGGVPPEGGIFHEDGVPLKKSPQERSVSGHVSTTRRPDGPGDTPSRPVIKTKEACVQGRSAGVAPGRWDIQRSEAHGVERGRMTAKSRAGPGAPSARPASTEERPAQHDGRKKAPSSGPHPAAEERPWGRREAARSTRRPDGAPKREEGAARPGSRTAHPKERPGEPRTGHGPAQPEVRPGERAAGPAPRGVLPPRREARGAAEAARQAARTARSKLAGERVRTAVKAAASTAKQAAAALRSLWAALLAGGWAAAVVVLLFCLLGLLLTSPFGLFFSGEDVNGNGRAMRTIMREINAEFSQRLLEIEEDNPHDELDVGGTMVNWRNVLAIYAVRHSTESELPLELVTLTLEKEVYLRQVFWDMNVITYEVEPVISTSKDGTETINVLRIRITGRSREEIAEVYGFNPAQMAQLDMLADDQLAEAWRYLLYGASGGSGDIVEAALAQVAAANAGGEKFWSWYGFEGRVDWCACFVSWCANECGYIDSGLIPRFASCTAGMNWFSVRGQWMERGYVPQPGDIIFFDWDLSGDAEHVGVVERVEGGVVYTVEGNSGDAVRRNLYSLEDPQIRGYGLPMYP